MSKLTKQLERPQAIAFTNTLADLFIVAQSHDGNDFIYATFEEVIEHCARTGHIRYPLDNNPVGEVKEAYEKCFNDARLRKNNEFAFNFTNWLETNLYASYCEKREGLLAISCELKNIEKKYYWTNVTRLTDQVECVKIEEVLSQDGATKIRLRQTSIFISLTVLGRLSGPIWVETHWQTLTGSIENAKELALQILASKEGAAIPEVQSSEPQLENNNPTSPIIPLHYGGCNNEFETIKVLFAAGIGAEFCIGNAIKYISRMGKKAGATFETDCEKAIKYLELLLENTAEGEAIVLYQPRKFANTVLFKQWGLRGLGLCTALAKIFEGDYQEAIYCLKKYV